MVDWSEWRQRKRSCDNLEVASITSLTLLTLSLGSQSQLSSSVTVRRAHGLVDLRGAPVDVVLGQLRQVDLLLGDHHQRIASPR